MSTRASSESRPTWGLTRVNSLLIFVGTLALAITFLLSPASRPFRLALELFLAHTAGTFLRLFDPSVSISSSLVTIQSFSAEIVPACTGLFTISIFLAAVLAYPSSWKSKLLGIAMGISVILTLNWFRIISLLFIGAYYRPAFEFAHLILWRSLVIFAAAFLWLFWVRRFASAHHATP